MVGDGVIEGVSVKVDVGVLVGDAVIVAVFEAVGLGVGEGSRVAVGVGMVGLEGVSGSFCGLVVLQDTNRKIARIRSQRHLLEP
jgi:hypothetical protein